MALYKRVYYYYYYWSRVLQPTFGCWWQSHIRMERC